MSFVPILVSICKKKNGLRYNVEQQIEKYSSLSLNFTVDIRFVNPETGKKLYAEVENID